MLLRRHVDWLKVGDLEDGLGLPLSEQAIEARARTTPARPRSLGAGYSILGGLAGLAGVMGFIMVILTIITHVVVHTQTSGMGFLVAAIGLFIFAAIGSGVVKAVKQNPAFLATSPDRPPVDAAASLVELSFFDCWCGETHDLAAEFQANLLPEHPWYDPEMHEAVPRFPEESAATWLAGIGKATPSSYPYIAPAFELRQAASRVTRRSR